MSFSLEDIVVSGPTEYLFPLDEQINNLSLPSKNQQSSRSFICNDITSKSRNTVPAALSNAHNVGSVMTLKWTRVNRETREPRAAETSAVLCNVFACTVATAKYC